MKQYDFGMDPIGESYIKVSAIGEMEKWLKSRGGVKAR